MSQEETYWPAMTRCPDCGRFMKRGLSFWVEHSINNCPAVKKHKAGAGILVYADRNFPAFNTTLHKALNESLKEYFND